GWPELPRLGPLEGSSFGLIHQRFVPQLQSGIFAQSYQGSSTSFFRDLVVQQGADSAEHQLRQIKVGHLVFFSKLLAADILLRGLDHDLQVFSHERVFFRLQRLLQLRKSRLHIGLLLLASPRGKLADLLVKPLYSLPSSKFRCILCLDLKQDERIVVAALDPLLRVSLGLLVSRGTGSFGLIRLRRRRRSLSLNRVSIACSGQGQDKQQRYVGQNSHEFVLLMLEIA